MNLNVHNTGLPRFGSRSVPVRSVRVRSGSGSFRCRFNSNANSNFTIENESFPIKIKNKKIHLIIKHRFFDQRRNLPLLVKSKSGGGGGRFLSNFPWNMACHGMPFLDMHFQKLWAMDSSPDPLILPGDPVGLISQLEPEPV